MESHSVSKSSLPALLLASLNAVAVSPVCDRCQGAEGILSHSFWFCSKLHRYWQDIFSWYSAVAYDQAFMPEVELGDK